VAHLIQSKFESQIECHVTRQDLADPICSFDKKGQTSRFTSCSTQKVDFSASCTAANLSKSRENPPVSHRFAMVSRVQLRPAIPNAHVRLKIPSESLLYTTQCPTIRQKIDYSDYKELPVADIEDPTDYWRGILNYIGFRSHQMYNEGELRIGCSSCAPGADLANILNPEARQFYRSKRGPDQHLDIHFVRLEVRPSAYVIRQMLCVPMVARGDNLSCWVFEGMDEEGKWRTLDEQRTFRSMPWPARTMAFLVDTDRFFTGFRIKDTNGRGLILVGLEIHGAIRFQPGMGIAQEAPVIEAAPEADFDPWTVPEFE
jgi:hypothetical protein